MRTKINFIITILMVITCSSLIIAQSPYHRNIFNNSYSINNYLFFDYVQKASSDFIRMDSLISTSVQGTSSKFLFQYNQNYKITEWLILDNFGSGWVNSLKNILFYDSQNNLLTEINLGWYINDWDSLSRINYSYEKGMHSQSVFQVYNNNSWENRTRFNYVYDQNQNLSNTLIESWINDNWQNSTLITYYYSLQNNRDSILFQTWVNSDWQNDKKTVYYYSKNQIDIDSLVVQSWESLSWINLLKQEVVNDTNHNQIEQLEKIWDFGEWLNSIRRFFTYNEYNFIESAYCEIWYNNQWINGDGDILFKGPDGFIVGLITNNVSAYYSNVVSVDEYENIGISDYSLSQNYPNPFNPDTHIDFKLLERTNVSLKVFNTLGQEVKTLVNEEMIPGYYSKIFVGSNLPSGVYFYELATDKTRTTKKMILLR